MPDLYKTYRNVPVFNVRDICEILTNAVGAIEDVSKKTFCAFRCCSGRDVALVAIGRASCG